MTIGTKIQDDSRPVVTVSGNALIGRKFSKTWSGQDYPPSVPEVIQSSIPVSRKVFVVRGGKREFEYVQTFKPRTVRIYPPRRARTEEHNYSMSISDINYGIWQQANNPSQSMTTNRWGWDTYALGPSNPWGPNDDLALASRLRSAVAGSTFNAGVFLGEGREALGMIADTAIKLYWGYRAAKQGDFRSAKRYLTSGTDRERIAKKVTSSNWLELQYGWLPLLNDVYDGAQSLAHLLEYPLQEVVRVSMTKDRGPVRTLNPTTVPARGRSYTRKSVKVIIKEKNVAKLYGLTDPLSVAWELVPYSFVLDWFLPIGDYLSARSLDKSLTATYVTSTKSVHEVFGLKLGPPGIYGPGRLSGDFGSVSSRSVQFTRSVTSSLSTPLPKVKTLGEAFSWKRAANAVALLTNRLA